MRPLWRAWFFGVLALALGQFGCNRSPPEGALDRWVDLGALDAGVARLFDPKANSCRLDAPSLYCNQRLAGGESGAGFWLEAGEVTSSDLVAVATGIDGGDHWRAPPTIITMRGMLLGKRAVIHSIADSTGSMTSLAVKLGDGRAPRDHVQGPVSALGEAHLVGVGAPRARKGQHEGPGTSVRRARTETVPVSAGVPWRQLRSRGQGVSSVTGVVVSSTGNCPFTTVTLGAAERFERQGTPRPLQPSSKEPAGKR